MSRRSLLIGGGTVVAGMELPSCPNSLSTTHTHTHRYIYIYIKSARTLLTYLCPPPTTGLIAAPYLGFDLPNPFRTPGVQNIEKRFTAGGGSPTHTPATASKRGNQDVVEGNQDKHKGLGTKYWQDNYGEQRTEVGAVVSPPLPRVLLFLFYNPAW